MMSEKEYDELEIQYQEADKMCDFWEENGVGNLEESIRLLEDLRYELLAKYHDDSKFISDIVFKLDDFKSLAKDRLRYWKARHRELDDELNSDEAIELLNSINGDYAHDRPDYSSNFGACCQSYDYVAAGMGI